MEIVIKRLVRNPFGNFCSRKIVSNVIRSLPACGITVPKLVSSFNPEKSSTTEYSSSPTLGKQAKKRNRKKTKLLNAPRHELDEAVEIASFVISTRELAVITMTRNLVINSWHNHLITPITKNEDLRIAEYFKNIIHSVGQLPDLRTFDYFVVENKYWHGKKQMNDHFLIMKSILHTLISAVHNEDASRQRVVYMHWMKTGKIFDLTMDGNIRKSGKDKTAGILKSGHWLDRPICFKEDIVIFSDAGVKVKKSPALTDGTDNLYEYVTEEMSDAFLQALAFWQSAIEKF